MLDGMPKDNDAPAWYRAARTDVLTHAVNEAFQVLKAMITSSPPFAGLENHRLL